MGDPKKPQKNLHEGHRERMYQRFLRDGLAGFDEHQALEVLLFFSCPRIDTNELAHRLIDTFGSLSAAMEAPMKDLLQVHGVGRSCALILKFIPQMCAYYLANRKQKNVALNNPERLAEYFLPIFFGQNEEQLYMLCLSDDFAPLNCVLLAEGSTNRVTLATPIALREASRSGAAQVVLAHNHPSGYMLPSAADMDATERLRRALEALGVQLVDHLVFGEDQFLAFSSSAYKHYLSGEG